PYESKLAFHVWSKDGRSLVQSPSAPPFDHAPLKTGFHYIQLAGHHWRGFVLPDPERGLLIWVGERDDVRQDLVQRIVRHTLGPGPGAVLRLPAAGAPPGGHSRARSAGLAGHRLGPEALAEHGAGAPQPPRRIPGTVADRAATQGAVTHAGRDQPAAGADRTD